MRKRSHYIHGRLIITELIHKSALIATLTVTFGIENIPKMTPATRAILF